MLRRHTLKDRSSRPGAACCCTCPHRALANIQASSAMAAAKKVICLFSYIIYIQPISLAWRCATSDERVSVIALHSSSRSSIPILTPINLNLYFSNKFYTYFVTRHAIMLDGTWLFIFFVVGRHGHSYF